MSSRRIVATTAALVVGALAAPRLARAQTITLCDDKGYGKPCYTIRQDERDLRFVGLNNRTSSFRMDGGGAWQLCTEANYRGYCRVFERSEGNLAKTPLQDRISSVRWARRAGQWGGWTGNGNWIPGDGGFGGSGGSGGSGGGFGGSGGSGGSGGGFGGSGGSGGSGGGFGGSGGSGGGFGGSGGSGGSSSCMRGSSRSALVAYDQTNFRGNCLGYDGSMATVGRDGASIRSIRINSGRWRICTDYQYRGACEILTSSRSAISGRFAGRIRSIQQY